MSKKYKKNIDTDKIINFCQQSCEIQYKGFMLQEKSLDTVNNVVNALKEEREANKKQQDIALERENLNNEKKNSILITCIIVFSSVCLFITTLLAICFIMFINGYFGYNVETNINNNNNNTNNNAYITESKGGDN